MIVPANAVLLASPAEDDQSAPLHVPLLPCTAFATPGTTNASMPAADARALPALPAFSASAASAAHPFASLPTDLSSCPLSLRGDPESARTPFGSGPDDRGFPISDPASFRPAHPTSYGPPLGRSGPLPSLTNFGPLIPPHGPGAALTAPGHGGDFSGTPAIVQGPGAALNAPGLGSDAPAHDNGAGLALAYAHGSAVSDALGPEASARIAADIMAIAQGVATTQADLEILRSGVADITECLENKIRDMWDLVEAEVKSEHDLQQHRADVAHERRVSDHETLEAHYARLNSAINDRFIEFDDRIFRMNESRAGSISCAAPGDNPHDKAVP